MIVFVSFTAHVHDKVCVMQNINIPIPKHNPYMMGALYI
jgi:hypothetical protein